MKQNIERQILWYHLYVESKKWYKWTDLQNRNRCTDLENKLMVTKEARKGSIRRLELTYAHTIYKIINEDLLYSTGNSTEYYLISYMGK